MDIILLPNRYLSSGVRSQVAVAGADWDLHQLKTMASLGRTSLDIQAAKSRDAKAPELSAVGQINEQVRRISLDVEKRNSADHEEGRKASVQFNQSYGLTSPEADVLLQQWGKNELVEKIVPTWLVIFRLVPHACNYFRAYHKNESDRCCDSSRARCP